MMQAVSARKMRWTEQEYLLMEAGSLIKHEYLDGEVFAMAGAKPAHNRVAGNALVALGRLLQGRRCGVFTSDQRIYVPASGLYTYPDGGLACLPWQIHTDGMCLLNPVLLCEVLSDSTREYDRGAKLEHYQQIASLRHVLLIDQPTRRIEHHHRSEGGAWELSVVESGALQLPDLGGAIALDDIYLTDDR